MAAAIPRKLSRPRPLPAAPRASYPEGNAYIDLRQIRRPPDQCLDNMDAL